MLSTLKNIACLAVIALSLVSCAREEPPAEVILDTHPTPYHIVKRGDTLESIASKYGMSKKSLIKMNRMKPPHKIYPGQRLLVRVEGDDDNADNDPAGTTIKPRTNLADTGDVRVSEIHPQGIEGQGGDSQGGAPVGGLPTMGSGVPGSSTYTGGAASTMSATGMGAGAGSAGMSNGIEPKRVDAPASAGKLTWPAKGQIIKSFGKNAKGEQNNGINIAVPSGSSVVAADNGTVINIGNRPGFGNLVVLKHQGGKLSVYTHLQQSTVREGQILAAGEQLGLAGQTGGAEQPQVHFELRQGKTALNPEDYLN